MRVAILQAGAVDESLALAELVLQRLLMDMVTDLRTHWQSGWYVRGFNCTANQMTSAISPASA